MPLLCDAVLRDSYDVVVVGSGLAGLTAAALIAKRGLGVLLAEHHYLPGGMCTTLRRQGFSFDTGTGLFYGFGEKGFNPHRFVMNDLGAEIDIIEHSALLRMRLPGRQITFWPDYARFVEELTVAFPGQGAQIRALYAYLYRLYTDVIARQQMIVPPSEMPPSENLKALLRHPIAMLQTVRMLNASTESVLKRFISDPELLAFFDKLTSTYVYCTTRETPAILAATMFVDNHVGGAFYPARSPQILASTLEKALEESGGQVLCGHRVDEILIENGAAVGVRLSDGAVVRSERVVANVTVWNLYGGLIRAEHIRPGRVEWAKKQVPTYPSVVLYIGVDAEAIPPGTLPVEMLIADVRGVNSGDVTLYISSLDDPSICPPGTHAITVIAPSMERWPNPREAAYHSQEYRDQKQRAIDRILDQIEGHFPGLRSHIRILEAGTPSTIERYTLKNGGAVGGPRQSIGQQLLNRLHARSDWKRLYLCGDSTVMGMGTPAVTVSGIGAASCVLQDAGLGPIRRRPFPVDIVHLVRGAPLPPLPGPSEPIDRARAIRLARECEYCERPGCTAACPAGIDMRNVMRRIEAGNVVGAARLCRETNPLSEVCGRTCRPNPPCEAHCNRLAFSDRPVRIAELQALVCREAGLAGWLGFRGEVRGASVSVVGAGARGLSCAYYLAVQGCDVTLLDPAETPGGELLPLVPTILPPEVLARDLQGIMAAGVRFAGGRRLGADSGLKELCESNDAVFLADGEDARDAVIALGLSEHTSEMRWAGNVLACPSLFEGPGSVVLSAAEGRRAAQEILRVLQGGPKPV